LAEQLDAARSSEATARELAADASTKNRVLSATIAELQAENATLRQSLEEVHQADFDTLRNELDAAKTALAATQKHRDVLQYRLNAVAQQSQAAKQQLTAVQREAESQAQEFKKRAKAAKRLVRDLKREKLQLESRISKQLVRAVARAIYKIHRAADYGATPDELEEICNSIVNNHEANVRDGIAAELKNLAAKDSRRQEKERLQRPFCI
jgi:predicted  nucleic acid-binding Zn-ribbon protein